MGGVGLQASHPVVLKAPKHADYNALDLNFLEYMNHGVHYGLVSVAVSFCGHDMSTYDAVFARNINHGTYVLSPFDEGS